MRHSHRVIQAIAFVSGIAALLYQVIWMRWFQVLFGSTAYAASATLCAFFAGFAIGSEFFGRRSATLHRPLLAYAVIETGAALFAIAVPAVFWFNDALYPVLYNALSDAPIAFVLVKFALAMLVMLPPSILLGGIFPLLAAARVGDGTSLGSVGTRLYAINTLGAAVGSGVGALWLPDLIGVNATYGVAIGLSLIAAIIAAAVSRSNSNSHAVVAPVESAPEQPLVNPPSDAVLRAVSFASGMGTLSLEVLLIHAIAQRLVYSVYSYGAVMFVVLICLAAGAQLVSLSARWFDARTMLGVVLLATATSFGLLPFAIEHFQEIDTTNGLVRGLHAALWLGGPTLLVSSMIFPLLFRLSRGEDAEVGRRVGGLLAVNTAGGIIGSVVASFVFLDALGLHASLAVIGLGYGAVAILVADGGGSRLRRAAFVGAVFVGLSLSPLDPWGIPRVILEPGEELVALRESPYGTVSVVDKEGVRAMKLNNHYTLAGSGPRNALKERAGNIPLILHPDPSRVLFLGTATGHTAGAAAVHPVEQIELVEIIPDVQELAAEYFSARNSGIYNDPRTKRIVEDARNHLRATDRTYDVIVGDLFSPTRPGVGALYAREHFRAVRDRLTPNGVFCQWLPLYQHREETFAVIARTFLDVFPEAQVFRGDFYQVNPRVALVGFAGPTPSVSEVNERVRELSGFGIKDRWVTYPWAFWMLYAGPLSALSAQLIDTPITTDAFPRFEYVAGRTKRAEIGRFLLQTWPTWNRLLADAVPDDAYFADARRAAADGVDLLRLNALERSADSDRHATEIKELRERLPADLIAIPDYTALEAEF